MILSDILNHSYFEKSKQIPININSKITGRVCLTDYLHALYIVKVLMLGTCQTYLETGVFFGGSMMTAMQCKYKTKFVGIDFFNGYYGKSEDPATKKTPTLDVVKSNIDNNNPHHHEYELVKGSSRDINIIQYIQKKYPIVDLLFIDGDHSYEGVTADFMSYSPLVRKNGIVMFDNYGDRGWKEVAKAVANLDLKKWNNVGRYGNSLILEKK